MLSIVHADSYVRKKLPSVDYPGTPRLQKHSTIALHPTNYYPIWTVYWKMLCWGNSQAGFAPARTRIRTGLWVLVLMRGDIEGQVCHSCGNTGLLSASEQEWWVHQFCMPLPTIQSLGAHQQQTSNICSWCPPHFLPKPGRPKRNSPGFWKAPYFCRQHLGLLQNEPSHSKNRWP